MCASALQVVPGPATGQLCAATAAVPPSVGISTSEQLRQLLSLLSRKNDEWSVSPSDRQLVVTDELQNSISKVSVPSALFLPCVSWGVE